MWRRHPHSGSDTVLLDGVSWGVRAGERWAVLGRNGAGKTTLLTLAGAVHFPSRGTVEILGERMGRTDVARLRAQIGLVDPRDGNRFAPFLTVRQVVLTGATGTIGYFARRLARPDRDRAAALLRAFGLEEVAERTFRACSEGERKRALIARALEAKPRLLLLDEPGAGLDFAGREVLLATLARLASSDPELTVIATTHHLEELPASTTHALLLRGGAVLAAGPVEATLTDVNLSACFGIPVRVARTGSRWNATAEAGF